MALPLYWILVVQPFHVGLFTFSKFEYSMWLGRRPRDRQEPIRAVYRRLSTLDVPLVWRKAPRGSYPSIVMLDLLYMMAITASLLHIFIKNSLSRLSSLTTGEASSSSWLSTSYCRIPEHLWLFMRRKNTNLKSQCHIKPLIITIRLSWKWENFWVIVKNNYKSYNHWVL